MLPMSLVMLAVMTVWCMASLLSVRHRVGAVAAEGPAPAQTADSEPGTPKQPVALERLQLRTQSKKGRSDREKGACPRAAW